MAETVERFDSYGQPPEKYHTFFHDSLKHYDWNFNKRELQSIWTDVCGQYCVFYLNQRVRGHSMNKIVHTFDVNTTLNDSKVLRFVSEHFICVNNVACNNSNQSCISWNVI